MLFRQIFHRESSTYTYLLASGMGAEAVIIDPVREQTDQLVRLIDELQLQLVVAIDTHTHADHVTALGDLRNNTGCTTMMGEHTRAECVSATFRDGEAITIGPLRLRALYTPGHTSESFSLVTETAPQAMVFTGDLLLIRGTGRTDFQGGDPYQAYDSIFNRILSLPPATLMYPAHDYNGNTVSTLAEERDHNPRLKVRNADEYAQMMNGLNLPIPRLMDIAVPANLRCGRIA